MNKQRERLIELLNNVHNGWDGTKDVPYQHISDVEELADYLLANGVIVPPCKLGDTVWYISTENPFVAFEKELKARKDTSPIEGILITKDGFYINTYNFQEAINYFDKVGEDYAYLTKEDAEAEIKRRERE